MFIARVKTFLHVVLCFSPYGDVYRARLRMYPSLLNCCTIDWFSEWPEDALRNVARKQLETVAFQTDEISAAIERVVHSDARRSELIRLGELRAKLFSWQECASKTATIYRELL